MPDGSDGNEFCRLLTQRKVAAVPGSAFMADESKICPSFRLNFSMPTEENIEKGVAIRTDTVKEYLDNRSC
jgi:2-aminoadipate transaminase